VIRGIAQSTTPNGNPKFETNPNDQKVERESSDECQEKGDFPFDTRPLTLVCFRSSSCGFRHAEVSRWSIVLNLLHWVD
jgi:hypothetical protein